MKLDAPPFPVVACYLIVALIYVTVIWLFSSRRRKKLIDDSFQRFINSADELTIEKILKLIQATADFRGKLLDTAEMQVKTAIAFSEEGK